MLKKVRLSFPNLRTKTAAVKGGKEKFGANFLLDPNKPAHKKLMDQIAKAVEAAEMKEFGKVGHIKKTVQDPKRKCYRKGETFANQDTGEVYDGYAGMVVVSASADRRPTLFNRAKEEVDLEDIEDVFYGGCVVDAKVSFFCISDKDKGGNGLFATVEAIRSWEEGESFGRAPTSSDEFDDDDDDGMDGGSSADDDDDLLG
ncbi:hypothetical protein AEAC466_04570 [Asticcacaulis sp. AC466]|nr:hypothetical protein AEAC466_04570 [Asticcacaulis sp. AC466]